MKTYFDYFLFVQADAWFPIMLTRRDGSAPERNHSIDDGNAPDGNEKVPGENMAEQRGESTLNHLAFTRVAEDLCHNAKRLDGSRAFSPFMENDRLARLAISGEIAFFFNGQESFNLGYLDQGNGEAVRDHGVSVETLVDTFSAGQDPDSGELVELADRIGWNA